MKVTVLGSSLCSDTKNALEVLKANKDEVQFEDISTDLAMLKKFCVLRENSPLFDQIKQNNGLGIPVFFTEDDGITLNLQEALNWKDEK